MGKRKRVPSGNEVEEENANQIRKQFRYSYACPGCSKTYDHLPKHLKICKAFLNQNRTALEGKWEAQERAVKILKNTTVNSDHLKRIIMQENPTDTYIALKQYLESIGHIVKGGQPNFEIDEPAAAEDEENRNVADGTTVPTGIVDNCDRVEHRGKIKKLMKRARLYNRINYDSKLMLSFRKWLIDRAGGNPESISEVNMTNVSRLIAFVLSKSEQNPSKIDKRRSLIKMINRTIIRKWLKKVKKCTRGDGTIKSMEKAVRKLIRFYQCKFDLTDEQQESLTSVSNYIKERKLTDIKSIVISTPLPIQQQIEEAPSKRTRQSKRLQIDTRVPKIDKKYSDEEILELVESQNWPGLEIKHDLPGRGRGVFATAVFPKGQIVSDYKYAIIQLKNDHDTEMDRLFETDRNLYTKISEYRLEFHDEKHKKKVVMAHQEDNSYGRLYNHSYINGHCNVNLQFKLIEKDGSDEPYRALIFYAKKDIKIGDEILWHYGDGYKSLPWWKTCPCKECQSK